MPHSLSQVILHIVFSTKNRVSWVDDKLKPRLYSYLSNALREHSSEVFRIGGTKDHIHMACSLPRTMSQSDLIKKIKSVAGSWMQSQGDEYKGFHWQTGYACFSVSYSILESVVKYIDNQEKHHHKMTFEEELKLFLKKYNVSSDERYLMN